ncbi:M48 family metalloprotease [Halomonas binhaiensis]|uniref:Putative beta-barrel assembly-enhancing protease n=1 Tax=Halomonas binhaiensis TaxID=2562282 RepID=A0A5C1NJN1_9GAMM|nr:M48 family metalloprotease [Halomonas binhaiensis]QEM82911.1 M48 family metallopeptidase [Halomonas binhaiensis]
MPVRTLSRPCAGLLVLALAVCSSSMATAWTLNEPRDDATSSQGSSLYDSSGTLDSDQNDFELPSLVATGSQAISGEEYRLGRAWLRQFRAHVPEWRDPIAQDYIESLVSRLVPYSGLPGVNTTITLVANGSLNAFAVPGGVVGVNSGLFAFARDEAEVASVLAHELGHLSQRHYARSKSRAEQTQIPAMAAMLAGLVVAAAGGGDVGIAAMAGTQAAMIQDQLRYSRRYEQEADRIGLQAMTQAGYDPNAMIDLFRSMQRMMSLQGGTPPEFLLTHPVTESRISDAEERVRQLHASVTRGDDLQYHLIRARALLAIHQRSPNQAMTILHQDNAPQAAQQYLQALLDAESGNIDAALSSLDQLAQSHPDIAMLPASAAQVAFEGGRTSDAIARAQRQLRLMPDYYPASLLLGEALLQQDPERSYQVLSNLSRRRTEDPSVFSLLAEAAGHSGHQAWGHLARAEQMQLDGDIDRAIRQLDVAEAVARRSDDFNAQGRVVQRKKAFREYRETMEKF